MRVNSGDLCFQQEGAAIRGSFVPDRPTQELRSLLRTRKQLVRERTSHTQRLQKTLEDANIKLDSVISDILGVSGRTMIEAMIAGQTDPAVLASLADRRIRATPEKLREALRGRLTAHHRFLLHLHVEQVDALDRAIERIDKEVKTDLDTFRQGIEIAKTIPGLDDLSAQTVLSEIGVDMSRYPPPAAVPDAGRRPGGGRGGRERGRGGERVRRRGEQLLELVDDQERGSLHCRQVALQGAEESPLGPLIAAAEAQFFSAAGVPGREPFHGYYYRILTRQGRNAPGGGS